jgi:hypothetical protein
MGGVKPSLVSGAANGDERIWAIAGQPADASPTRRCFVALAIGPPLAASSRL